MFTVDEAAAILGKGRATLVRWIEQGLLSDERVLVGGRGQRIYVRKEALDVFRKKYLFTEEAASLLGIHPAYMRVLVKKGFLHPVAGGKTKRPHFVVLCRKEVEVLQHIRKGNLSYPALFSEA